MLLFFVSLVTEISFGQKIDNARKYRYAYSTDGFNQDRDDVAGSAMAVALFDKAGLSDRVAHFHFNTNFGGKPSHAEEHRKSVLQTGVLFGMIEAENAADAYFDVSRSKEERLAAIEHLSIQMSNSTLEEPLIMICAGGVQTVYLALEKAIQDGAQKETLSSTTFLSHGKANEITARKKSDNPDYHNNWASLELLLPNARFIDYTSSLVNGRREGGVNASQNSTAWNQSPRNKKKGNIPWKWLKDYGENVEGFGFSGTKGEWLLGRLKAAGAPEIGHNGNAEGDASDAGMIFGYVLSQPTDATMEDIKQYFMGN